MEFAVIGDENVTTGFRLAGIKRTFSGKKAKALLPELLKDESIGVLVVTEKFAKENQRSIAEHRASHSIVPIIVEIPDVGGPMEGKRDPLQELIRRAIGAEITLK